MADDDDDHDECWTISVPEAGRKYFQVGRDAAYAAARDGTIPTIRVGRRLRVPVKVLEQCLRLLRPAKRGVHVMDELYNWAACIARLMASRVANTGRAWTVGEIFDALDGRKLSPAEARRVLARGGLGLLLPGAVAQMGAGYVLAVPNASPLVAKLFQGSDWAAAAGAIDGLWKEALRQAPADIVVTDRKLNRMRIAGAQRRCTLLIVARWRSSRVVRGD